MAREIKFRGKRVDNGEWVEGDLLTGVNGKRGRYYILPVASNLAYLPGCHPLDGYEVILESIGQFTGLKDKKGVDIYDGDLLRDSNGDEWVMSWYEPEACYVFQNPDSKSNLNTLTWLSDSEFIELVEGIIRDCEVIGPIHDKH